MSEEHYVKAESAAWIGLIGNVLLALMKGTVGVFANSKALLADAAYSVTGVAGSIAVLIGMRSSKLTQDGEYSYRGQNKTETIAAIVVPVILLVVGFETGMSALKTIRDGVADAPNGIALLAIFSAIVVKEALYRYKYQLDPKLSGQTLLASAWDHRSDVYSSIVALVGVVGALVGKYLSLSVLYYLDPIAGVVISLLILRMGIKRVLEAIHHTMEHALHQEDAEELLKAVQRVKGVIAVDDLRAHEQGHYVVVDIKISVNPRITVLEGNDIAKMVKLHLMKRFIHVSDVFIHVYPYDPGFPYKINADSDQDDFPTLVH
jgi:cation diffusion facilitator family transporter